MVDKKRKYTVGIVLTVMGIVSYANQSQAASYQSLREVREAAWDAYYMEDTSDTNITLEKTLSMNGAVDESGGVKVQIENWEDKGMLKEEPEASVFTSMDATAVAGKIYEDTVFSVLGVEGDWTKIHSGYLQGYVESDQLYYNKDAKKRADQIIPVQIVSNVWDTKIMASPDENSRIVDYMGQRKVYTVEKTHKKWNEIRTKDGVKGYVHSKYIEKVRSVHLGRPMTSLNNPQAAFIKETLGAEERRLLAAIIHCEARGEVFEGQIAVGAVVMNRVHSEDFPNTVKEVIYQDGQFEPVLMNRFEKVLADDSQITQSCYEAADMVIQGTNNVPEALYFRTGSMGIRIGGHGFY